MVLLTNVLTQLRHIIKALMAANTQAAFTKLSKK